MFFTAGDFRRKASIKGNLRRNAEFWEENIQANEFVLDIVKNGYSLPFLVLPDKYEAKRNNLSALKERVFVEAQIQILLEGAFISEVESVPFCVNPLTVAENESKLRLVLDMSYVNDFLDVPSFKYEGLSNFSDMVSENDYAIKFDLTSGYHHIEIHREHKKYLGFKWIYEDGTVRYFVFDVLPFGCASACHAFTKIMRALLKKWRSFGLRVIIYIDDGICVSDGFEKGQEAGFRIKSDLESAGFVINQKKSIWSPTQKIDFLGFSVSTTDMTYEVPIKKIEKFKVLAEAILKSGKACAKDISRVTGRLVSMQPALGNLVYLTTRCMFAFIAKQSTWFRKSALDKGAIDELNFWSENLSARNGFAIKRKVEITRVIFSDASERGFGGFLITKRGQELAKGDFSGSETGTSSTHRELLAVKYVMESFGEKLAGQTILWYTDNQNVPIILRKGSAKLDLTFLALEIFSYTLKLGLEICPV